MSGPINKTQFYADFQGLASLKQGAKNDQPDALKEAAKQFESLFTRMLLKNMRAASMGDSMFDSQQTQFYQDMFDDQLAVHLSQGKGLGLADMLVRQLQKGKGENPHPDPLPGGRGDEKKLSPTPRTAGSSEITEKQRTVGLQRPLSLEGEGQGEGLQLPRNAAQLTSNYAGDEFGLAALVSSRATRTSTTEPVAAVDEPAQPTQRTGRARTSIANSPQEFIQRMLPHAQKAAREIGVDPHALVAQAALETGWGKSVPCSTDGTCSYNLFGIKANADWNGGSVGARTLEFESGIPVAKRARFRSYESAEESFRDYAALIGNSQRYSDARNTGSNVQAFAKALQEGGYATDPHYARKLSAVTQTVRNLAQESGGLKLAESPPLTGREGVRG